MEGTNQTDITLYTLIGRFERVKEAIISGFAEMTAEVFPAADERGGETLVIRLKDDSDIVFRIGTEPEFIRQHISGMYNYFANIECGNKGLHKSVLKQIRVFNCAVSCSFELTDYEDRTNYIINALFAAAKDINGLLLMPDARLFSGEGKLVFSPEGKSDLEEYIPIANADAIDSRAEESPADKARKERSIAVLEEDGVPYTLNLPVAAAGSEAKIRSPEETAERLLAMFTACVYSEARANGETWKEAQFYLEKMDEMLGGRLDSCLSAEEKAYLAVKKPKQSDIAKFSWRYECCYVLMWALGFVDDLGYPDQTCNVSGMTDIVLEQGSLAGFLENAKPRTKEEVLDAADLILRYDWACVDARVNKRNSPAGLNGEVVFEWHYAFNWLIGANGGADWDDIKTHT